MAFFAKLSALAFVAFWFFLPHTFADEKIDVNNYQNLLMTQDGNFFTENGKVVLRSKEQSIIVVKTGDMHETVEFAHFSGISSPSSPIVFIWKLRGQEYSSSNQMQLSINNGVIRLPDMPALDNFDFIGFVFFSSSLSFETLELRSESFLDKISIFLKPELVKPSTINLLYGPKFGKTPFVEILGILSLVLFLILVFFNRKWAFLSLLLLWLVFDLRYTYDQYSVLRTTYETFVKPSDPQLKTYYDFGNFYGFIEESKKYIQGGVNLYAPREWPFNYNYHYHLYPIEASWQTTDKPYYAIFQMNAELKNGKELYIDGKSIDSNVSLVSRFDDHSFIFKKN